MHRSKKRPQKNKVDNDKPIQELHYEELLKIVKSKGTYQKDIINDAYNEIETRMKPKIMFLVNQFYISGFARDDIYQESLFALRFKAIPDYDNKRGRDNIPYPFDKFAVLCIRRHLSTLLKSSFQNKKKVLSTSISLDQDRNENTDENLFLSDILPSTKGDVLNTLGLREYHKKLFSKLYEKLSKFEKHVFLLYMQRNSYDEMTLILNDEYKAKEYKKRVKIKSIDNALSRIKQKGKDIFTQFGD